MNGIDWNRYAQLCEELYVPAIERFTCSLCAAANVATYQSIPAYAGAMKANLATVLRTMVDVLKQLYGELPQDSGWEKIRWKKVEDRMRDSYFKHLLRVDNLFIVEDYMNTRIRNQPSDRGAMFRWVNSLRGKDDQIRRIADGIRYETFRFIQNDVPAIMNLAKADILLWR